MPAGTNNPKKGRLNLSVLDPDFLLGLSLFLAGLYAYSQTLAPTVLEGDAALFQYTPYVLGVTYPTGYPFYLLLGKLWITLFPIGEVAWRMNLFSALCSAAALPLIYGAARRILASPSEAGEPWSVRWGALSAALIFATLPTFWRWSTEAKIYALNILLFSGVLYTLSRAWVQARYPSGNISTAPQGSLISFKGLMSWFQERPLALPVLLLGLQISVHSTTVLLIPGFLLFAWLHLRPHLFTKRLFVTYTLLLMLPGLLYFYIPIRAEWLIAQYSRPEAIGRGLLADFYHSGLAGLIRYFTAADFTGGVVSNWGLVVEKFTTVYLPLLEDDLTRLGIVLGLAGGLGLIITHPRRFLPLFLLYAAPIPFVLTYGQGEQSAFLLPSYLIFSMFAGYTLVLINLILKELTIRKQPDFQSLTLYILPFTPLLLLSLLIPYLLIPQIQHNVNWLTLKWNRAIYEEWADALNHPLAPQAGMLAHWGDLTSFWYMQHVEGRRPDLQGVYPPDEVTVMDWYAQGHPDLYIAGPLQGWAAGIEDRYQLLPWGRLVRIAPKQVDPQQLLPVLPQPVEAIFEDKLRLIGIDYPRQAMPDQDYPVILTWQALADLPPETTVSLRLTQGEMIVAQLDDTLRSGWFPTETLPAGQYVLSYAPVPIPLGTLPGEYQLQLVVYTNFKQPWSLTDGQVVLDLGIVEIGALPATHQTSLEDYQPPSRHDFNGEIRLVGYDYSVSRVGQGKGFAISLLWQALSPPADNYILLAEIVSAQGEVLRAQQFSPINGQSPTASWQTGQFIRDQIDLIVPAGAPPGEESIYVQLSWLRPNGTSLNLRRWGIPLGHHLALESVTVTEKEERVFELPARQYPLDFNLENKVRLLGYDLLSPAQPVAPAFVQISQAECARQPNSACIVSLTSYWQGLNEMEKPYQIFFHVVDSQGNIVTQKDDAPGWGGKQPTTGWLPGEVISHPVELPLPATLAPGRYTVHLGMYLPPDGPRLFVLDAAGQAVSDFVEVLTIEIKAS